MIFGGSFHRFGTVLDREVIPLNLRKSKNLEDPNTPDPAVTISHDAELEQFYDEMRFNDDPEPDQIEPEPEEAPPPKAKFLKRKLR